MSLFIRIFVLILGGTMLLYSYIDKSNDLMELRLEIPKLKRAVDQLQEENIRLEYEVDRFESPKNLMQFLKQPEFRHLHHPLLSQIIIIEEEDGE